MAKTPKPKPPKAAKAVKAPQIPNARFGIGEWFGKCFTQLSGKERQEFASEVLKPKAERTPKPCPFQPRKENAMCSKDSGVCSLRLYSHAAHPSGLAMGVPAAGRHDDFRATCPHRFHDELDVFRWVGETILGDPEPRLVGEVGFLEGRTRSGKKDSDDVGRIDMILVSTKSAKDASPDWVALEIQGVYFSGDAMTSEFKALENPDVDWIVFPTGSRRPDYRSCGPKRLMPQLQIKVPTLSRWGKRMAVVVDRAFFDAMGNMEEEADISNADIAWFIVRFEEVAGQKRTRMVRDEVRYTTLTRAVEGLTGGKPVAKPIFETRIAEKPGYLISKKKT